MKKYLLSGGFAGLINGFLGGGGGAVFVPLLQKCGKNPRQALANSVATMLPISILSACLFLLEGDFPLETALPYVVGGAFGGFMGGKLFSKVKSQWLQKGFSLLMILSGVRCLL